MIDLIFSSNLCGKEHDEISSVTSIPFQSFYDWSPCEKVCFWRRFVLRNVTLKILQGRFVGRNGLTPRVLWRGLTIQHDAGQI
jgi:hypothetical protein